MSIQSHNARHRLLRDGLLVGALAALGTGLLPTMPANAAPPRADLVTTLSVDTTEVPASGGWSTLTLDLRNSGTKASRDVTVAFTLPPGAWFSSDGFLVPANWHCDLYGTATCTHAPLAAEEVAERLNLPFGLPTGTAGDTVTIAATAQAGAESSITNNVGQASVDYIPSTIDLEFEPAIITQRILPNEQAQILTSVRNTGNTASGDVTVISAVPVGMYGWELWNDGWDCTFGDGVADGRTGWRCTHGPLQPGQTTESLTLSAKFSDPAATTPGDAVTFEATASTTSAETTLDNNTARNTVTVEQSAMVRGAVWVDSNYNGVRDANESGAALGAGGIDHIIFVNQTAGGPHYSAIVKPDGTYVGWVRPGTYRVEFNVRNPYKFFDSADSDIVQYENVIGGSINWGDTDSFTVATGDLVTLNAGVKYLIS